MRLSQVACPWRSLGCGYIGPLCELGHHKKGCEYNPDLLPEALRNREIETLVRANSAASLVSQSVLATAPQPRPYASSSSTASPLEGTAADDRLGVTIPISDEDDDDLLPVPPPSLLMRLYKKSDQDERGLLCDFFSTSVAPREGNSNQRRHL